MCRSVTEVTRAGLLHPESGLPPRPPSSSYPLPVNTLHKKCHKPRSDGTAPAMVLGVSITRHRPAGIGQRQVISMRTATHLRILGLTGAAWACLALTGCEDDVIFVEDGPPAVPSGVYTVTGDRSVDVFWSAVRDDDVAGYGVYRSRTGSGAFDRIATLQGAESTGYTDFDVANGVTYFYAVDAFDERGHESALSYEDAFDTPRPSGQNITAWARENDPIRSGIDMSDWRTSGFVTAWNAVDADLFVRRVDGVLYLKGTAIGGFWNDVQDLGYTESMDDVSWAPGDGWSVSPNGVELIAGHTYVVWTHDSYFAFDDFVYSDKTEAGNAIGAANMSQMYDEALTLLGKADAKADAAWKVRVNALKARTEHAKAVWGKNNPVNTSAPYVSAGASTAANALALMETADWKWKMNFSSGTVSNQHVLADQWTSRNGPIGFSYTP